MMLRKVVLVTLVVLASNLCSASQQVVIKNGPIKNVSPFDGKQMYMTYCATCHGEDGRGTGPAASALKRVPTDLSVLAKNNNGKFPDLHVQQLILGDESMISSHGSKDMPAWRGLFYHLCRGSNLMEAEVHLRIVKLSKYIGTLQQ